MSTIISPCGEYRYRLERKFGNGKTCLFLMLNPSTADGDRDDATVRRCLTFARNWGYGRLLVGNLFAFRATKVSDLKKAADPIGPHNFHHLKQMCREQELCIAGWGEHGKLLGQDSRVLRKLARWGVNVHFLKLTRQGRPCHPLYLKGNCTPQKMHGHTT